MTEENPNNEYYINMFHDYKKSSDEAKIAKEIAQKEAKIKEEIEKTRLKKEAKKREKESA